MVSDDEVLCTKTESDYFYGWIKKKKVAKAKSLPRMVNPRDLAGNAKEEDDEVCSLGVRTVTEVNTHTALSTYSHRFGR